MFRLLVATLALAALSSTALAEIVEATPTGFLVRFEVTVNAPPDKAYATMTGEVGSWWNMDHSYSRDGKNLTIDARPGGCFCEKLANGGGVQHMSVVFASPASTLRMVGGLGPLQGTGVAGSMTFRFIAAPPGTKIEVSYSVGGYFHGGLDKIAAPVNGVVGEQVNRLKSYIDTGKPTAS
ncbi:MAG: ATPase [Betaproteobacteria bacterium]